MPSNSSQIKLLSFLMLGIWIQEGAICFAQTNDPCDHQSGRRTFVAQGIRFRAGFTVNTGSKILRPSQGDHTYNDICRCAANSANNNSRPARMILDGIRAQGGQLPTGCVYAQSPTYSFAESTVQKAGGQIHVNRTFPAGPGVNDPNRDRAFIYRFDDTPTNQTCRFFDRIGTPSPIPAAATSAEYVCQWPANLQPGRYTLVIENQKTTNQIEVLSQ